MKRGYSIIEHPADLGIEANGNSLADAFIQAALGLMSVIVDPDSVESIISKNIHITADDKEQLLVKWLSEILYLYDGKKFISKEFQILLFDDVELNGIAIGEPFSASKHKMRVDVKAITYHQLVVEKNDERGKVRVFLDI
ncbi:MAG: archease [Ignavibacteriales bacterium]|nr:archease [Ignavibacteriales bacterium]